MTQKLILFIFAFFVMPSALFSQATDTLLKDPDLILVNTDGGLSARKVKKKELLKVKIQDQEKPIIGTYSYVNDSILKIDDSEVKISEIESIRTTNNTAVGIGAFFLFSGAAIGGFGLLILSDLPNQSPGGVILLSIVGGGAVLIGGGGLIIGILLFSSAYHTYSMENWQFEFRKKT